jgi:hypothetical protein
LLSNNYFQPKWAWPSVGRGSARRIKNVIVTMEWVDDVGDMEETPDRSLQAKQGLSKEQEQKFGRTFGIFNPDRDNQVSSARTIAAPAHLVILVLTPMILCAQPPAGLLGAATDADGG